MTLKSASLYGLQHPKISIFGYLYITKRHAMLIEYLDRRYHRHGLGFLALRVAITIARLDGLHTEGQFDLLALDRRLLCTDRINADFNEFVIFFIAQGEVATVVAFVHVRDASTRLLEFVANLDHAILVNQYRGGGRCGCWRG